MATNFPGSNDTFTVPSSPGSTALSSAGDGTENHTQSHRDLGDAVVAMQVQATLLAHSHDGSTARHGSKLLQANTHQTPDTDTGTGSLHHTLGTGANQSAAGNHTHTQAQSHNSPDTDTATSSLHHTIGTGANNAAAGNHVHAHPLPVYFKTSGSFTKATYPGLYAIEVEVVGGGGGVAGLAATDGTHWAFGPGGAGGGYAKVVILAASLGTSETVTVGAGGTAGTTSGSDGGDGGTTSFGAFVSATGGGAGNYASTTTSAGGHAFGGKSPGNPGGTYDIGIPGQGTASIAFTNTKFDCAEGLTGTPSGGPYGQKLQATGFSTGTTVGSGGFQIAQAGVGYGSGACGPVVGPSASAQAGATGSPGLVVVRLIY